MEALPPAQPGTILRILATTDLAGAQIPVPTSYGVGGTCAGVVELLEVERGRQPTVWLDAGDFTVGPAYPLLGTRPWADMAELPIAAATAGNHEFDDGVPALLAATRSLPFPLLCANLDVGLPASALVDTGAGPLGVIGLTHPHVDRLSNAPPPAGDWAERVGPLAGSSARGVPGGWWRSCTTAWTSGPTSTRTVPRPGPGRSGWPASPDPGPPRST